MKRKTLCQTVAGNNCDYLAITDYDENGKKLQKEGKKSIMITMHSRLSTKFPNVAHEASSLSYKYSWY